MLSLLVMGLITACSNNREVTEHRYLFTGEAEYWEAEFRYEADEVWGKDSDDVTTYSSEEDYTFKLTYKGELDDLSSMEELFYEYERGSTGKGSSLLTFEDPVSTKEFTSEGSGSGSIIREDMVITVKVKWYDHEESFELVVKQ